MDRISGVEGLRLGGLRIGFARTENQGSCLTFDLSDQKIKRRERLFFISSAGCMDSPSEPGRGARSSGGKQSIKDI